ncbi:unnamed protein product [Ectocarpus sp. 12 AP-2014]
MSGWFMGILMCDNDEVSRYVSPFTHWSMSANTHASNGIFLFACVSAVGLPCQLSTGNKLHSLLDQWQAAFSLSPQQTPVCVMCCVVLHSARLVGGSRMFSGETVEWGWKD